MNDKVLQLLSEARDCRQRILVLRQSCLAGADPVDHGSFVRRAGPCQHEQAGSVLTLSDANHSDQMSLDVEYAKVELVLAEIALEEAGEGHAKVS